MTKIIFFILSSSTLFIGEIIFRLLKRRPAREFDLRNVQRILIIRTDSIGDFILTTPLLRCLRNSLPNARLSLVVRPDVFDLASRCTYVNEVLPFDIEKPRGLLHIFWSYLKALRFFIKELLGRRFDLSISPRWDIDSHYACFLAYFSGAPWRAAYSEKVNQLKASVNKGYDRLYTHVLNKPLDHEVELNRNMLLSLGGQVDKDGPELWLENEDIAFVQQFLTDYGIDPARPLIAISPGAGRSRLKRWPIENFAAVISSLQRDNQANILLLGAKNERAFGEEIAALAGNDHLNLIGKTTLPQALALLRTSDLFLGNDSGLAHLASAAQIPIISLFGASCEHRFAPWGKRNSLIKQIQPCSRCLQETHDHRCFDCVHDEPLCMHAISVAEVIETIRFNLTKISAKKNVYAKIS